MVILDTCAVIEICKSRPSFSSACLKKIEEKTTVLSISFAEIACKVKLGKLILDLSPRALYQEFSTVASVTLVDIGCQEWFESIELEWDNKDPADRLIVAYAQRVGSPIVTTDGQIKTFYKKVMW